MRRSLTPNQRQAMYAEQKGICGCGCGQPMDEDDMTGEHEWCVAFGNNGKPNKLYRNDCAKVKTFGKPSTTYNSDLWAIAKTKRLARKREGAWRRPKARIASRGFPERPEGHQYSWPKRKVGQ